MKEIYQLIYEYPDGSKVVRYEANGMKVQFEVVDFLDADILETFDNPREAIQLVISEAIGKPYNRRPLIAISFSESEKWGDEGDKDSPKLIEKKKINL